MRYPAPASINNPIDNGPALVSDRTAATFLGVGRSTFWRLWSVGKAPAPVRLGRRTLWRVSDLAAFVAGLAPVEVGAANG